MPAGQYLATSSTPGIFGNAGGNSGNGNGQLVQSPAAPSNPAKPAAPATVNTVDTIINDMKLMNDTALAGIMDASSMLPEGVPSHWSVYFRVEDTDATLAAVSKLGGATVMPAEDTPYGRLAVATDATGTQFKLVS